VSLDRLVEADWLDEGALADRPEFDQDRVEYDRVRRYKLDRLRSAFEGFQERASERQRSAFESFRADTDWLDDYALFRALKTHFDGAGWTAWPAPATQRDPDALASYREELADEIAFREFVQFCFDRQWDRLHGYAADRGVRIVGDMPIYVGIDSADAWANPALFDLDESNQPAAVAGMPTSPDGDGTGQRWGNPLYDWAAMADDGYDWWVRRFESLLSRVDLARVDHFKGFDEYWAIPADADTAAAGEWREGPGRALFDAVEAELGSLPLVAEDLGGLTPALEDLRDSLGAPGMKVVQYADWCADHHVYLPHTYPESAVAYTSTHDTDTVVGWYEDLDERQRTCLHRYLDTDGTDIHWRLIESVWSTDAVFAITQLQDPLALGSEARFNRPGTESGNWAWRVREAGLDETVAEMLAEITRRHGRA